MSPVRRGGRGRAAAAARSRREFPARSSHRSGGGGGARWEPARRMLVAHRRGVNRPVARHRHRGHFLLGHLVQHEPLARGRDPYHQAARLGSDIRLSFASTAIDRTCVSSLLNNTLPLPSCATTWTSPGSPVATSRSPLPLNAIPQMYLALGCRIPPACRCR